MRLETCSLDVTVVIPHYGPRSLTDRCLEALRATTSDDVRIIVVDNGTGDEFDVPMIRNETNRGYAAACNQGVSVATTPLVVLLNNDTEPQPDWLPPLVAHTADGTVAAASGVALDIDGQPQEWLPALHRDHRGVLFSVPDDRPGLPSGPVRFLPGFALLVRRSAFESVGGFDEGYWNGHEDIDLMLAFEQAGWKLVYEPSSRVVHHVSSGGYERWVKLRANRERLTEKWSGKVVVDVQRPHPPLAEQIAGKTRSVLRLIRLKVRGAGTRVANQESRTGSGRT